MEDYGVNVIKVTNQIGENNVAAKVPNLSVKVDLVSITATKDDDLMDLIVEEIVAI